MVQEDGRHCRISQPDLRYDSGRGQSHVGPIYDPDGYACCVFTGRMEDDRLSWNTRQNTQQEPEREIEGQPPHSEYIPGRRNGENGSTPHRSKRCCWKVRMERGDARPLGLCCTICTDKQHGLVQMELIVQNHSESIQHAGAAGWISALRM